MNCELCVCVCMMYYGSISLLLKEPRRASLSIPPMNNTYTNTRLLLNTAKEIELEVEDEKEEQEKERARGIFF